MSVFRKLSRNYGSRRKAEDVTRTTSVKQSKEFETIPKRSDSLPDKTPERRRHSRTHSLGNLFSRRRQSAKTNFERYDTDFWERNFQDKSTVPWHDFRAAFLLDYKRCIEEFARSGHLSRVFKAVEEKLCNKDLVVYIARYKRFIGPDAKPDAMWLKVKEDASRMIFEDGLIDSLCL